MKAARFLNGLLLGLALLAGRSAWAEAPAETPVAKGKKHRKKAGAVDKYGGHYGSDGFYYDRFGGHYDKTGYEFKDGSYKSITGAYYDAKTNKIYEADGSEGVMPPEPESPKEVDKPSKTRTVQPTQPADAPEPAEGLDAPESLRPIPFAIGTPRLRDDAGGQQALREMSGFLAQRRDVTKVRIEGHTNNSGTDKSNLALSRRRALAIKDSLVKMGVESERLVAVAFGQAKPIADNATAAGRARNERVDFHIVELNGNATEDVTGGGLLVP